MTELLTQIEDLLVPWLPAVHAYTAGRPKVDVVRAISLRPVAHHVLLDPFHHLSLDTVDGKPTALSETELVRVSCAMELVALALRLEPHVWGLLKSHGRNVIDLKIYTLNELGAGVAIEWPQTVVDSAFAPLLACGCIPVNHSCGAAAIVATYDKTKRHFHELDTHGRLEDFQIPLTLRFPNHSGDLQIEQIHALLAAIVATTNVETSSHNRSTGAAYRLAEVEVPRYVGSVDALKKMQELGIDLLACGVNGDDEATQPLVEQILQRDPSKPPVALDINRFSTTTLPLLQTALGLGGRLDTLHVTLKAFNPGDFGQLAAQVLRATEHASHSLRRLEVDCRNLALDSDILTDLRTSGHPTTVGDTGTAKAEAPSWQLESLTVRATTRTEASARRLVTALTQWIPASLKLLHLDARSMGAECLRLILQSFRHLELLSMEVTDVQPLLDAFSRRECGIQRLMLQGGILGSELQLLETLADPETRLAKTLTELVLIFDHLEPAFAAAFKTMLCKNVVLEYVDIHHVSDETATHLDAFHGSHIPAPMASRVVSAFISVVASQPASSALGSLDSVLMANILAWSRPTKRRIVLTTILRRYRTIHLPHGSVGFAQA